MVNVDDAIIARLESFGEKFEILVDADLAADFRNPDHTEEIPIEDKVLLYTSDLDWVEEDEAAKLSKLKKYSSIKKMI